MAKHDYDLIVIGGGSGGVRAGRWAARYGAKAAVIEAGRWGGTCVNRGCIPKKLYAYAAHFHEDYEDAVGYGWELAKPGFDWPKLVAAKEKEITRLNGIYAKVLEGAGVERIAGWATVEGPHAVAVNGKKLTARYILIATGGKPSKPGIPGEELGITSDEAFDLPKLPQSIVIVGGGYIALEFAGIFNGLGVETTVVHRGDKLLRGFDEDLRAHIAVETQKKGVKLALGGHVIRVEKARGLLHAVTAKGKDYGAEQIMFATGRDPLTRGIGLEAAGVAMKTGGAIEVDTYSRSSVGSIYAIGDATDRLNLTPVALHEAMCFAETMFNDNPTRPVHRDVATAVFSQPNLAAVGLTEEEARKIRGRVDIYRSTFKALKHALSGRDERTLMKLVVEPATDRVLGCHMIGADAGEIIQGLAIAVKCGATKAAFDATIGIHPTAAEEFVTMRDKVPEPAKVAAE